MPQRRWLTVSLQSLSPYKNCNLLPFSALVVSFMEHYFSLSSAFAIHCLCHSRLARGISLFLHPTEDFNLILGFSAGCGSPNWSCVVLVIQWCPNLCNPMDCSQPGSSVHEIFQERIVEWVAISFSNWSWSEVKWSEVPQLCPTLCDSMDCSLSCFSVHGIFQARVLEWIAISFSRATQNSI